ncbi:hypothetical protein FGG08_001948 [Glutinoglossum americanum]|uniref:UBX domain-containing protein n=1 Tax=Glutinoglossum americanum TaxID=1670608 RepID=A0A9P8L5Y2_9PEZI|nr:hypothetical protein FGG08_001948 [Glutinoglossum americanum]
MILRVVVLIHLRKLDGAKESSMWEDEYLKDETVATLLDSRAVLLRMEANSQEAGFLSAFCPITKVPTLVAICDGHLRAYLPAGITKEQFVERLKIVLQPQLEPGMTEQPTTGGSVQSPATASAAESPTTSTPEHNGQGVQPPTTVQALLSERRTRLEVQKRAQDAAEKQERIAKAKARREAVQAAEALEAAHVSSGSAKARNASYAQQQRKIQLEAKQERERIMKLVENDKAERREREQRRKALETGNSAAVSGTDVRATQFPHETQQDAPTFGRDYPIQVRLLDGSTIRTRFPSDATIRGAVRSWIDQQRSDGDIPYMLKQILAPLPSRAITISDEDESLQALGFAPSATLVLVPIQGYTNAYRAGPGLLSGSISAGYSLLSSGAGMVVSALGTFLGVGGSAPPRGSDASLGRSIVDDRDFQEPPNETANSGPGGNIKTLRDHEINRDDRQLYNGNQLNFEPNRDDDGKED